MENDGADALRSLEAHPVLTRPLPGRGPLTYRERAELGDDEARRQEGALPSIKALPEWRGAEDLIRRIGRAAYAPAVPVLARLWRTCPVVPVRSAAGHALFAVGIPEAHAELQVALERCDHCATFLAIKSIVIADPKGAYDRLAPYLSDGSISTRATVRVASAILEFFQARTRVNVGDESWIDRAARCLRDDPRWVERAIELSRRSAVERSARMLLGALNRDELDAAFRRWPRLPEPRTPSYAGRRDFVSRYQAGEHEAVWRDLRSAGPIEDASLQEEAMAVATLTMQRVRRNVAAVTERLQSAGYPFHDFVPPWSPPPIDVARQITRIEDAAGGGCPVSLRAFWSVVGEVSWKHAEDTETPDAPWEGVPIAEADPLCVYGPGSAWWSVEEWLQQREKQHPEAVGPLEVVLAPDYLHKANISGGLPYAIRMPSSVADPPFENEEHALPFVDYLRLCFRLGGFSRVDRLALTERAGRFLDTLRRDLETF
jgi:hypothetical protein